MTTAHLPVLRAELVAMLSPEPGQTAIDCTFGAGGHGESVLERVSPDGTFIAIDRDLEAEHHFERLSKQAKGAAKFIRGPFAEVLADLTRQEVKADVIYFDLGISSMQVDKVERGFSYAYEAPLDMRMDQSSELNAATIVNEWDEARLAKLIHTYGEERFANRIARAIVEERRHHHINTTGELVEVIANALPAPVRFAGGHPAKRTFQALRIAVNDELDQLRQALPLAWELLVPGGRVGFISFHSLEDRAVKRFLAAKARGCTCPPDFPVCVCGKQAEGMLLHRRAIKPTATEIANNPRARSARLRVAKKLEVTS